MRGGATDGGRFPTRMTHEMRLTLPDGAGGTTRHFDTGIAVWARIEPLPAGGERETPDGFSRLYRVTMRSRAMAPGDRLTGGGLTLTVRRALDPDGTRRLTVCDCAIEEAPA